MSNVFTEEEQETIDLFGILFGGDPLPGTDLISFETGDQVRVIGDDTSVVFKAEIGHETEVLAVIPALGAAIIDTGNTQLDGTRILQAYKGRYLEAVS